ncbi:MAG: ABC transporter ATP-binding protein [Betaproteobacteria bacterium RIFCSPLOWO2_12_FULL_65_14]|nr:MAG: ABC transporter ATP-binding protein [Betaproteobacteria bacterium RIFCSPLOWO2_12_FULL_65_14]
MPLLTLQDAQLAYGELPLLDRASFALESGERIGLIGRNGTGKSSLLGVIAGRATPDDGELRKRDGLRVALVEQEPVPPWPPVEKKHRLAEFLHRFGLDENVSPATLSGGEAKRAALAHAFALEPDLLLLDEPTNHLDIDGILQLENLLLKQPAAIVVTHDRAFLDRVATRILELDRGMLRSYAGNFSEYERLKSAELAAEAVMQRKFDRFWAQEEAWIRKGIEARRTRDEGRVRRLEHLREERAARRERAGSVKLAIGEGQRSGKLVAELTQVTKSYGGRPIVKGFDLLVSRGDRIGLIGPNGAGKTTLLKLILGTEAPDAGRVRLGTNVQPAYFDQMREALDPEKTVAETISPGSEWVEAGGARKHVMSYLGDFLFPPRRANSPVRMLSGGERNRLLLARLFARPANVLVLDEPTNDLDIESLELLEAALQDYGGTLLLVSHDRAFLDNVVTQTIAAEGDGVWKEYVGGYSDYLRQRPAAAPLTRGERAAGERGVREKSRLKLSYKETRELEALPHAIEALEAEQKELFARMHAPDYYRQPPEALRADQQRSAEIDALLHEKLERWEALEQKQKAASS